MKKFGQVKLNGLRDCKSFPIPTVRYWFTLSKLAILLLLGLLLSISRLCFGQTPVTISGIIQDSGGNVATSGTVEFDIQPQSSSIHYTVPGVTAVAPQNVVCGIASNGTLTNQANVALPCTVWGNDVISPANSTYTVIFSPNGQMTNSVSLECITGSGPYNISSPVFCPQVKVVPQYNSITTAPIGSNIIPSSPHVFTLGNSQSPYAALYADNIFASGSFSVANLTGKSLGGLRYSAPYAGLLNAMAPFQTVITDPTDTITGTAYNLANPPPGLPSPFGWIDYRKSNQGMFQGMMEVWQDWGYTRNASFNGVPTAHGINCLMKQPYSGSSATAIEYCNAIFDVDFTPGLNLGTSSPAVIGGTQWVVKDTFTAALFRPGGGVTQTIAYNNIHYGHGDTAGIRGTTTSSGGEDDGSGEGNESGVFDAVENSTLFSATLASCSPVCTTGVTQITLTSPVGCTYGSSFVGTPCPLGTERPMVDITQGPTANSVCGLAAGLSATLEAVTLCTPIAAASNAWGTLAGPVQPNGQDLAHPPFYTTVTFSINVTSGTFVANDPTKPLCLGASNYWDVAQVTSVSGSGPVTITANVYKPHASGAVVMQGGPCASGMEIAAETVGTNVYLGYIIGATDTSTLQVTWYLQTGPHPSPVTSGLFTSAYLTGSASATGISSNGTSVYVTGAAGGTLAVNSSNGNKQGFIFSGASDGAFNGTACTNSLWLDSTKFTCTMAGLTGIHSAGATTFVLASAAGLPLANINIWKIAHVMDVQDEATTPPQQDGAVTLMTNTINPNPGDTFRQFNHQALQITGSKVIAVAQNMHSLAHALSVSLGGLGATGGGASTTTNSIFSVSNGLPDSSCIDGGGLYTCANIWNESGPYNIGYNFSEAPTNGQSMFSISPTTLQRANPNYDYNFLNSLDSGAGEQINIKPLLGDMSLVARGQLDLGGTGANIHPLSNVDAITMNDKLSFSAVTTPTGLLCVTGPGAGSLADGTYFYTIGCRNSSGFCLPSTEVSVSVGSSPPNNNSIKCTWNRTKGVDVAYQLYGRTTGTEQLMPGSSSALFYVDDGSQTPSGAMPTVNTTLGFVDQAAQIGINSLGAMGPTAFEGIIKAPANLGSNQTYTLPATGGTIALTTSSPTKITNSITPAAATASQCVEQTFTYTGLVTTQQVSVSPPASLGAHVWIGSTRVSSSNTLAISFCGDATAGTPPSGNYIAVAF